MSEDKEYTPSPYPHLVAGDPVAYLVEWYDNGERRRQTVESDPVCWLYETEAGTVEFAEQFDEDVRSFPVYRTVPDVGWQTIRTAPRDGTRILAWCKEWSAPNTVQFYGKAGWLQDYSLGTFKDPPTHWMSLPEPPFPAEVEG